MTWDFENVLGFFKRLWRKIFDKPIDDDHEWFEDYPVGADRIPEDVWKKFANDKDIKE